jgi:hypothetical protein
VQNFLNFILILGLIIGCAKKTSVQVEEAVDQALTLLSDEKCDDAIKLLEDVGRQPNDPIYLQVLASAYACRAGFRTVDFIVNDVPQVDAANLLKSTSLLSLSNQTAVDDAAYTDIKTALSILQGIDKQANRTAKFGSRKAGDIGIQILLLSFVQLGKYVHFFGNVDASGVKGAGTNTNSCFINYTHPAAMAIIAGGGTGACTTNNDGHPDMSGADLKRRLCEGSTLVANIIDVIKNVYITVTIELSSLESITATVDQYRADAESYNIAYLIDLTSQSDCETLLDTPADMNNMQTYFAALFETQLQ